MSTSLMSPTKSHLVALGVSEECATKIVNYLITHDWTYEWSDDNRVYRAGSGQRRQILELLKETKIGKENIETVLKPWLEYYRVSWNLS